MKGDEIEIRLSNLKDGKHCFEFELGQSFFESINSESLVSGHITLAALLDKSESMLQFRLQFKGQFILICDRSLDEFPFPVEKEERLFFKKGEAFEELSDDLWVMPSQETHLNLTDQVVQLIYLMIPTKCLHPRYDSEDSTDELFFTTSTEDEIDTKMQPLDPRWEALNKLKDNN